MIFDESMPTLQPHMSCDDNDVGNSSRKQDEPHDFLEEAKPEDQCQEEHLPSEGNKTQGDVPQVEELQLPSNSNHDLPRT